MNLNNFTLKAQEAVQKAQEIAEMGMHPQIENAHLLKAILTIDENVAPFLLKKMDVNVDALKTDLEKILATFPKVTGGQVYLS